MFLYKYWNEDKDNIIKFIVYFLYIYFLYMKKNLDYIRLIRPSKDQIWSYVLQTVLDDLYFTWTQFDLNSARLNQNSINTTCSPGLGGRTIRWGWLGSLVSPRVEPQNCFFFFFFESQVRLYLTSFLIILSSTIEKKKKKSQISYWLHVMKGSYNFAYGVKEDEECDKEQALK